MSKQVGEQLTCDGCGKTAFSPAGWSSIFAFMPKGNGPQIDFCSLACQLIWTVKNWDTTA